MECKAITLDGGVRAIICASRGRGSGLGRCQEKACKHVALALCDWPMLGQQHTTACTAKAGEPCACPIVETGKTCDRKLCADHAEAVATEIDFCPKHARIYVEQRDAHAAMTGPAPAPRLRSIATARMGYTGPDWLDVTLQGNLHRIEEVGGHRGVGLVFAPAPELFYPFLTLRKNGRETPEMQAAYASRYREQMRRAYVERQRAWQYVLSWERVVLLCFCEPGQFCHRLHAAAFLAAAARRVGLAPVLEGEIV